jgi:hypothetical protein
MRERGADKAPRSVSYAALRQRPARLLRNPARPLFYLRRLAPTKSQRCNIPQGLAPWVDPFGLAATKSLRDLRRGAAASSRNTPVAIRSLVKSGEGSLSEVLAAGISFQMCPGAEALPPCGGG